MLALFEVHAVPEAAAPFEHEQVFCVVHTRLVVNVQAVVSVVPVPQVDRHALQNNPVKADSS